MRRLSFRAEAGIFPMPGQSLQEDPGFRRDDRIVGLFGRRRNKKDKYTKA